MKEFKTGTGGARPDQNRSIKKAFQLVEELASAGRPMRLQELSASLGMPATTILRFLGSLVELGYVSQDPETRAYRLTLRLCEIGERARTTFPWRDALHPFVAEARHRVGESASLSVMREDSVVYVDSVEGPDHMLQTLQHIGKTAPLHSTGAGKVLLAGAGIARVEHYLAERGLPAYTPRTITAPERFRDEISEVGSRGFAWDNEECELGVRCLAVPIRDYSGIPIAALSVSAPVSRLGADRDPEVVAILSEIALKASERLGFRSNSA